MIKMILTHSDTCRHAIKFFDRAGVDFQPYDIGVKAWSKYTEAQRQYLVNLVVECLQYVDGGLESIFHRHCHGTFMQAHEDLDLKSLIRLALDQGVVQTPIIYDPDRQLVSVGGVDENLSVFLPKRQLHARRQLQLHQLLDHFYHNANFSN